MIRPESPLTSIALPERLPSWGVLVIESHHAPNFTMEWRTHRFIKVIHALSGSGSVLIGDKRCVFSPRDVIIIPPGTKNRIIDDKNSAASLYVFCLATSLVRFDKSLVERMHAGALHPSVHFANQVQRRLRRMLFAQIQANDMTAVTMVADALQLLSLLIKQPQAVGPRVSDTIDDAEEVSAYVDHLKTHFFEATTIDDAADRLGLSRRRFTRQFKDVTGESWLVQVRRLRIEHAQQLLTGTSLPITSVAFECGFEDLSTFYRQFKGRTGFTPGQWRDQQA